MEEKQEQGVQANDLIRRIVFALRRSWLMILIIIVLFGVAGGVYSYLRKPTYTASQVNFYKTLGTNPDDPGNPGTSERYLPTIIDFCNEGCVVDRANFYYSKYLEYYKDGKVKNVDEIVELIRKVTKDDDTESDLYYTVDKRVNNTYIDATKIGVINNNSKDTTFKITLTYTDPVSDEALNKVKVLGISVENEVNLKVLNSKGEWINKYFYIDISMQNYGVLGEPVKDVSIKKILIIFLAVGVAVSLVAVYLRNLFNRTVRSKEDIEELTGVGLLAYIADQGAGGVQ